MFFPKKGRAAKTDAGSHSDAVNARLADASRRAAEIGAEIEEAERALRADVTELDQEAFADRRAAIARLRHQAEETGELVKTLEAAAAQAGRKDAVRKIERAAEEMDRLTKAAKEAAADYVEAARRTWDAAQRLEVVRLDALDVHHAVSPIWSNDIGEELGRPYPKLGIDLPDLSALRLPAAGDDGEMLADEAGIYSDCALGWHREAGASRHARIKGAREGIRIARALRWR